MLHIGSSIVVLLLAAGILLRRQPRKHVSLMLTSFVIDVALVLYIEITRHAVETVATQVRPLVWFHALISAAVLVCYVLMIRLGRRLLRGETIARSAHRRLAVVFVVLRATNYVTSFMV